MVFLPHPEHLQDFAKRVVLTRTIEIPDDLHHCYDIETDLDKIQTVMEKKEYRQKFESGDLRTDRVELRVRLRHLPHPLRLLSDTRICYIGRGVH